MNIKQFKDICNINEVKDGECIGYYSLLNNPKCLIFNGKKWECVQTDEDNFIWVSTFFHHHKIDKSQGWEQFGHIYDLKTIVFNFFQTLKIEYSKIEIEVFYKYPFIIDNVVFIEIGVCVSYDNSIHRS